MEGKYFGERKTLGRERETKKKEKLEAKKMLHMISAAISFVCRKPQEARTSLDQPVLLEKWRKEK